MSHLRVLRGAHPRRGPAHTARGAATTESVLLIPLLMLILSVMLAGWRLFDTRTQVEASAEAASRAASVARSASVADRQARLVAAANLRTGNVSCINPVVQIETGGFWVPVGQPADIEVTLTCTVPLSDLLVPGMPGQVVVTKRATSPLDRHRQRGP